jgi:hypothetical protein
MMIEQCRGGTMQYTVDTISQLATAMASDCGKVAMLTATNAKLASQLEAVQAFIKILKDEILALKAKLKPAWQGQRSAKSTNTNTYFWSHVHQVRNDHTSATCKARKDGHQEMATKDNTMGGVAWGKECRGGAANVIDLKLDQFALTLDCIPTMLTATTDDTAILDSGCTSNLLSATVPYTNKKSARIPLSVNMPNGTSIQLSHTCDLLTDLPPQARKAHVLPVLVHNLLMSAGQLCENGCDVTFNKQTVSVMNNGKCVMIGARHPVNLKNSKRQYNQHAIMRMTQVIRKS